MVDRSPLSGPPSFNRLTLHTHLPLLPSQLRERKVEVEMLLVTLKHQTTDEGWQGGRSLEELWSGYLRTSFMLEKWKSLWFKSLFS